MRRVVLVGATGVFGSRLAALLARRPDLTLVLAARRPAPLERLRQALIAGGTKAEIAVALLDRARPEALPRLAPWLVVDAAGPFQDGDRGLARAAIGCGAHYVDLADARGFVAEFPAALDAAARAAGVVAVTGASSTPALSHAALTPLVAGWSRVDRVHAAISPGARAPRGRAVMEAILSYAGRPVRVWDGGAWRTRPGWSGLHVLDMPGLGRRLASLCETPDLDLLPARVPQAESALFLAGLELKALHLGLALLGLPVRWGLVPSLRPLAGPLLNAAGVFAPLGTDRGGMIVEAEGRDGLGRRVRARWGLWAEAGAGPSTPAAPAAALVGRLADGGPLPCGAYPCVGLLSLDEILAELAHLPIRTRFDEALPDDPALFRRLVGRAFDRLPAALRAVHGEPGHYAGEAVVRAGRGPLARGLCRLLGLPRGGRWPLRVEIAAERGGERWTRCFGPARFRSRLSATGRLGRFAERIGPLRFTFALRAGPGGVVWEPVGWALMGLPLPALLGPRVRARAGEAGGRYRFRVAVAHPWTGLLFAYRGSLDAGTPR